MAPRLNAANQAETSLDAAVASGDTSISVVDASVFPGAPFRATISDGTNREIVEATSKDETNNNLTVTRGQEDTTAASWSSGDTVEQRFTAGTYGELSDQETSVSDGGSVIVAKPSDLNFTSNISVSDDGDGTVSVDATDTDTRVDVTVGASSRLDTQELVFNDTHFNGSFNVDNVTIDPASSLINPSASDSGTQSVVEVEDFNFGSNLSVTDDGDSTVTINGSDTTYSAGSGLSLVSGSAWSTDAISQNGTLDITTNTGNPRDIYWKDDGTKFYIPDGSNYTIEEYSVSTAWDPSTATHQNSFDASGDTTRTLVDVSFNSDGTKMLLHEQDGTTGTVISEYQLTTAWDTTTVDGTSYANSGSIGNNPGTAFAWGDNGNKVYVFTSYQGSYTVEQYDVSTAYDVTTVSTLVNSTSVSNGALDNGLFVKDSSTLFASSGGSIYRYSFGTDWDVTTLTLENSSSLGLQDSTGLDWKPEGDSFGVVDNYFDTTNKAIEYDVITGNKFFNRLNVEDSGTSVANVHNVNFGSNVSVTDDGDNTVTVDATDTDTTYSAGDGLSLASTTFSVDVSQFAGSGLQDDGSENLELVNDSVTVAGNLVSLGGSTTIDHADLSNIGGSDHHTRPTAGQGIVDNSNSFDARLPIEDAGTAVTDAYGVNFGSNLTVTDDGDNTVTVDASGGGGHSVSDSGTEILSSVSDVNFSSNLSVSDDGDGTVSVNGTDTRIDVSIGASSETNAQSLNFNTNYFTGTIGSGSVDVEPTGNVINPSVQDSGSQIYSEVEGLNFGNNLNVTDDNFGLVTIDTPEEVSFTSQHTQYADALSNEEIYRLNLQSGETFNLDKIDVRQKGGGTSSNFTVGVYDNGAASVIDSATLGSTSTTGGSSNSGSTILIRVSNSTGGTVEASVTVHGTIN